MSSLKIIGGLCCLVIITFGVALGDGWHIETVDSGGQYTSIALDSSDNPHISYSDYTNSDLKYACWNGSSWSITSVDTSGDVCNETSIALDSLGYPHIAYSCHYLYEDLMYAYLDSFGWHISSVDTIGAVGGLISMALDSIDNPHISYYDFTNRDLKYAYWTGSTWSITSVDTYGEVGLDSSIALDSSDNPHISYYEYDNHDLKYAYRTGSGWNITSVDTTGDVGWYTSIALDSSDYPHISYFDYTNCDLKYAYWTGATWYITSIDTEGDVGWFDSMVLDSSDYPHISYYDNNTNYDLKYAYWTGYTWYITSVDTAGTVGYEPSIVLDSSDYPHISYFDFSNSDLKYAFYNSAPGDFNLLSPDNDSYVSDTPTMDWEDSEDVQAVTYDLWFSTETDFDPHNEVNDLTESTYTFPSGVLTDDETYYWKVRAWDGSEETWSGPDEYWSFHVNYTDINLLYFSAEAGGGVIALTWSVQTTEDEDIIGFNLYRRTLTTEGDPAFGGVSLTPEKEQLWTQINPTLITGENPYAYTDSDVESGVAYEYKLEAVLESSAEALGTTQVTAGLPPASFAILALYPNPASDTLTCLLALPSAGAVQFALYDLSGRLVIERRIEVTEPSEMEVLLDVSCIASGVYTIKASLGGAEVSPACGGVAVVVR